LRQKCEMCRRFTSPCAVLSALSVLCCAVLCCAVLCCAVLCCAVLCCAVLCCAVLCCAVLCCLPCLSVLQERVVRLEKLRLQREMAGSSNLDKAAMKTIICEQAFERKRDHCLLNAVENQARFAEKMAYIEQQRRVEHARVAAMTEESDQKAVRSQKVIDAKREVSGLT
jgi:hypothetical protein